MNFDSGAADTVLTALHSWTASIVRKLETSMTLLPSLGLGQDLGSPAMMRKGLTSATLAFKAISNDCCKRLTPWFRHSRFAFQSFALAVLATSARCSASRS